MVKDIVGNELNVGDTVAFNPPTYKGIILGTVVSFTPKMVQVKYRQASYGDCTVPQYSHNLMKVMK